MRFFDSPPQKKNPKSVTNFKSPIILYTGDSLTLYYSLIMSGKAKCLIESQRLEVISKMSEPKPPSKRGIARQYDVMMSMKCWKRCKQQTIIKKRMIIQLLKIAHI